MDRGLLDVLLITENQRACCHLVETLVRMRCRCWFASTAEEIRALLKLHPFRLVLSTRPVTEQSALTALLKAPRRTIFYSVPVEHGCLWFRAFPEIVAGQRLSALRPAEFMNALNDLIARSTAKLVGRVKVAAPLPPPTNTKVSPIPSSNGFTSPLLV
jgi:hypothetical protein